MTDERSDEYDDNQGDDQIIATTFRWSMLVVLFAAVAAAIIFGAWQLLQDEPATTEEAQLIAPRTPDSTRQVEPPNVQFTDITAESGIAHVHRNGAYGDRMLPETMGGGIAVLDFDNDQNVDLLFVDSQEWPWRKQDDAPSLILYRGDGSGSFEDVSDKISPNPTLYGMGAAVGDYDRDGFVDIFVTVLGANRLFRNVDGTHFEEATASAGVAGEDDAWSTGAAFVDYDRDGDLDLAVINYVTWSRDIDFEVDYQLTGIGRAYGPPAHYAGTYSYLYRNDGDGTFSDVSEATGFRIDNPATGRPLGKGLAVLPLDVDGDGWTDLMVANDTVQNFLFMNESGQRFREVAVAQGVAFDNSGAATSAMGIDDAALAPSMERAVAIGNFGNEMTSLYLRPQQSPVFTDQAIVSGIGPASRRAVTFGLFFFDYDLDGRQDLLQANGHVENEINVVEPGQTYKQPPQLFWNCGYECPRQFVPVPLESGNDLSVPIVGRGASYADIDRDGDQDVILTQAGFAPRLLRNDQQLGHNWIQFDIRNEVGQPAIGATVDIVTGDYRQRRRVEPTRSYLSQVETTQTFGIGTSARVDYAEVNWPDGTSVRINDPATNQRHRIDPSE